MMKGVELFCGIKAEAGFGHLLLAGLGGIFIEVLKDVSSALVPVRHNDALRMIRSLKGSAILKGARGQQVISEDAFAEIITRLSLIAEAAPMISEMDLNPLLGTADNIVAVDARICIARK
jgi:acetyltransferase